MLGEPHDVSRRRTNFSWADAIYTQFARAAANCPCSPPHFHSQAMRQLDDLMDSEMVADLTLHVEAISKHVPLRPIRTEHDYDAAVASMNRLLDAGAADEAHPLADLVATLGELIGDYDAVNYPATDIAPRAVLRALMDQQGLTQSE